MGEEKIEGGENGREEKEEEKPIVIKVDMHCEACAKKVAKCLEGFQGVEEVAVERKANVIVVKGKKADPIKVCQRIQSKTGRKALLLSPLPPMPSEEPPKDDKAKDQVHTKDDPKDQPPPVVTVELRVHMHCEACAQLLRKHIRKVKGVESVETDVAKGKVMVKGIIGDAEILAKYVYKRTRKQVSVVKNEEKKEDNDPEKKESQVKKEEDKMMTDAAVGEMNRYDYYWPTTRYNSYMEHPTSVNYQPQFFSEENPNACSLM